MPDGDSFVYTGASVTKAQLFTLVFAFSIRAGLTGVDVKHLLALFNAVIPGCLPNSRHLFQKLFNTTDQLYTHLSCPKCKGYLCPYYTKSTTSSYCNYCKVPINCHECVKNGNFFSYTFKRAVNYHIRG